LGLEKSKRMTSIVFTKEDMTSMPDKGDSPHNTMDPIIVTIPGVEKLLKNIKPFEPPLRTLVSCL
jgi:hypothetical protein